MNINKYLKKSDAWLTIIIIIGIILVVNFLSYQIFYRWDLTQSKDYSISKASKNTVKNLEDILNIKIYFSKNLPSQYITLQQEVGDIVDEYTNYSNNKIKVEFIDPETLENSEQTMYLAGIPALQFNVLEKDKYQVVKGYLGMVVQYGDKKQAIPVIENTNNLEYQITTAIKKVTSKKMPIIGFLQANETLDAEKEITFAFKGLEELYEVRLISFETNKTIPDDIDTLIIAAPKKKFIEDELKQLDKFLLRGGSLLVLLENVKISNNLTAEKNDSGLASFLEKYGIKVNYDLVLDAQAGMASFNSGFFTFTTNYPFWPKIIKNGFDQNNASVAKLESLVLPWVSSVEIQKDKIPQEDKISILVKTSNNSWSQTDTFDLNPQQNFSQTGKVGQKDLAVSVFGKFSSAYENKTVDNARIIVVGDGSFIEDNFLRQNPDNLIFFQNMVDSLSLDEDLINIRSKGVSERPIKEIAEAQKITIKFINILGVTIIVVLFGLIRYFLRRRSRFADEI